MKVCMVCKMPVKEFEDISCLDSAGYVEIYFGFGSKNDSDTYSGFIHDHCLETLKPFLEMT